MLSVILSGSGSVAVAVEVVLTSRLAGAITNVVVIVVFEQFFYNFPSYFTALKTILNNFHLALPSSLWCTQQATSCRGHFDLKKKKNGPVKEAGLCSRFSSA